MQNQIIFVCILLIAVAFCQPGAPGPADVTCSLVGYWTPSAFFNTYAIFLANGTVYGNWQGGPSIDNSQNICGFRGTYTLAHKDAYFTYNVTFVDCPFFTSNTDHSLTLNNLFCVNTDPNYDYSRGFSAGCFAAFDSACTTLQFSNFQGENAGASTTSGVNEWTLTTTAVPKSHSAPHTKQPARCRLNGITVATSPSQQWHRKGLVNTTYTIQYTSDKKYVSSIVYSGSPSCYVSWKGNFTYGHRYATYPNDTAYPYSASSVIKHSAAAGSYCAIHYTTDPALCPGPTADCLVVWNDFQFGEPCTGLKIVGNEASPTLYLTAGDAEDLADDAENLVANSGASSFELAGIFVLSLLALLCL